MPLCKAPNVSAVESEENRARGNRRSRPKVRALQRGLPTRRAARSTTALGRTRSVFASCCAPKLSYGASAGKRAHPCSDACLV